MKQVTECDFGTKAVLTAPLSLEGEESNSEYRAPNIIQRILSLLTSLPPQFNIPKSQLQCYGESVYSISSNMLSKCAEGETSLNRFVSVVAWSISMVRPLAFGLAPYNPVLGETHHVSRGTLNVLLEQVSHHPPVSALHATDEKQNIDVLWCQSPLPKFHGTHIEIEVHGKRQLKLLNKNETYTMSPPNLVIRFLPVPGVDWLGMQQSDVKKLALKQSCVTEGTRFCPDHLYIGRLKERSFCRRRWRLFMRLTATGIVKDVKTGKKTVIYNAKEALTGLKTPIVKDPKAVLSTESAVVWGEVSQGILQKSWDKAREAKTCIEERQRQVAREKTSREDEWSPKHFIVSHSKESGWDCSPTHMLVPPAPIVVND
ncbi:UNVERIFIED_CONTAM: Oxysterol-binding protein-related protein 4B [Sesamum angustifolium]|uniref:Oxysterol-binding protein-related protein 4B n=1 Tax=Sesamum angustifolium TaxID=2727405 RepID=A0AAW2J277_9LAMI